MMEQVVSMQVLLNVFEDDFLLRNILSYVGEYQFRFVAGVNRMFHKAYLSLYPTKETYKNASNMKLFHICYDEFDVWERKHTGTLLFSAAMYGNIDAIQYLYDRHYIPEIWKDTDNYAIAIKNGHVDVLKWMYSNGVIENVNKFMLIAVEFGNLAILEWIYSVSNGGLPQSRFYDYTSHEDKFVCKFTRSRCRCYSDCECYHWVCCNAAENGHLHVLQWARSNRFPWGKATCWYAAKSGHLFILQWARENGCPWYEDICLCAAENGHLHVIQWARDHDCPWDEKTCSLAAENGHLNVIQWARENGCTWDSNTCAAAARGGHLHVLQWAHENGCPWGDKTCCSAAINGHLHILQWAREHGCPWDEWTWSCGRRSENKDVIQWLEANGCPRIDVRFS